MKTSNYLAKLPQEAAIKNVQAFRDYDLITLNIPAPRQRLCPHCGSTDCVIKDSGIWQTVHLFFVLFYISNRYYVTWFFLLSSVRFVCYTHF